MSVPTSRETFKKWCLRKLGAPTIEINVTDEQVDDRIDEALHYFFDYHMDGTEKQYYKYELQQSDIDNKYITLPQNIIGVSNIFPVGDAYSTNNLFNIRYQLILNDLYDLANIDLVPYYTAMMHVAVIEEIFVGQQLIRFNRYNNILYIDMDWSLVTVPGYWIIVEASQVLDPDTYTEIWADKWLGRYATALIKENWGEILSKYKDMPTAGGMVLNWQDIKAEAKAEKKELEEELINTYSIPAQMFIG
jgi:hypothetical protein